MEMVGNQMGGMGTGMGAGGRRGGAGGCRAGNVGQRERMAAQRTKGRLSKPHFQQIETFLSQFSSSKNF